MSFQTFVYEGLIISPFERGYTLVVYILSYHPVQILEKFVKNQCYRQSVKETNRKYKMTTALSISKKEISDNIH